MAQRKGPSKGSGGKGRRRLQGRGPTPPAERRTGHPAARHGRGTGSAAGTGSAGAAGLSAASPQPTRSHRAPARRPGSAHDVVAGRNPVVEALRARVPATALYVQAGGDADARVSEAVRLAADRGVALLEVTRAELDRLAGGAVHQGITLAVPAYRYADPADLPGRARPAAAPLLVALDGVTDPHNLGAVVRSAAAFGAHGVIVPERRSAGMTAAAWKASAGAAARLPVARATNLVRTLKGLAADGLLVVGLAADGELSLADLEAIDPLVVVVGSEGRGLSRLVGEACDLRVRIPMVTGQESLNASVAAGVALWWVAYRRGVVTRA